MDFNDIVGKQFGSYKVLDIHSIEYKNGVNTVKYKCICTNCGTERIVTRRNVKAHKENHCIHCVNFPNEENTNDLIGNKYGMLTIIGVNRVEKKQNSNGWKKFYDCKCDCGNNCVVERKQLIKSNPQRSCGCIKKEIIKKNRENNKDKITESINKRKQEYSKTIKNKYDLTTEYGIGYTSNTNKPFYFDLEDYDKIKYIKWRESDEYYICGNLDNKEVRMHRYVLGLNSYDGIHEVDHKNRERNDNRKSNLNIVESYHNMQNKKVYKTNKSGVSGVTYSKTYHKWIARISIKDKRVHLGYFENKDDAIKARIEAEKIYWDYKISLE